MDQLPSSPIPATISASDLGGSDDDQLPENNPPTDLSDHQLITEVITSKPIQEEDSRSIVVSDHLIDHLSEKIENQNVSDCVKFIRATVLQINFLVGVNPQMIHFLQLQENLN